ncbi:MAG: hypothetical protein ACRENE_24425, partial [Polyangiaceae bacterium]
MSSFAHDSRDLAETYDRVSDSQFERGKRVFERLGLEPGGARPRHRVRDGAAGALDRRAGGAEGGGRR